MFTSCFTVVARAGLRYQQCENVPAYLTIVEVKHGLSTGPKAPVDQAVRVGLQAALVTACVRFVHFEEKETH